MISNHPAPDVIEPGPTTRRCWRCLQNFACAPDDIVAGPAQWWLCDPCQLTLIGPRSNPVQG